MPDSVLSHEPIIRLAAFAGILAGMAAWEVLAPRRDLHASRLRRWPNNLAIVVLDTLLVRLAFPLTAVGLALLAETRGWGLFNAFAVPGWLAIPPGGDPARPCDLSPARFVSRGPAAVAAAPVHHADPGFDVTTGVRFHPFEIALSVAIKLGGRARAWNARRRRGAVRNAPERDLDVQPRQRSPSARAGPRPAPARRDSRYASRAPLDARRGNQQQFRLQSAMVGPPVSDLPRAAAARP